MKKLLLIILLTSIILSACSQGSDENSWLSDLVGTSAPPTPTVTPTPQPKARVSLGEAHILAGDYEAALNEFWTARAQSTDPEIIAAAQLGVGRVLLLQAKNSSAVEQLNWLLTNVPEGEIRNTAYFYLAVAYNKIDQFGPAADAYGNYLRLEPGPLDSEIYEMQGDAYRAAGDHINALTAYRASRERSAPGDTDILDIKIAQELSATGDDSAAINAYLLLYDTSTSDAVRAQVNLLLGQIYLRLNEPEQAYARFQASVENFPVYYDTYSGLVALVEANQPVNELMRGIVDYYAGKYGVAIEAFDRFTYNNQNHPGDVHYFKALSLWNIGDYEGEIAEWDKLIQDHPTDEYYYKAFLEKATTLEYNLQRYEDSASTRLTYVAQVPDSPHAPGFLYDAAQTYERGGFLSKAAATWERIINEYPSANEAYTGLFQAGIVHYRLGSFEKAQVTFQRIIVLALSPEEQAAALFWVGKCLEAMGKTEDSLGYYQQAVTADPTGYYSIRANEKLNGFDPFPISTNTDLSIDLALDKLTADDWMITTFKLDPATNFSDETALNAYSRFQRGKEFTRLGLRDSARGEFNALREELKTDPLNTYRLLNYLVEHGYYQVAVLSSRQVLDQAGLSQPDTLTLAPVYFNHIRFGIFFREIIVSAANENGMDPLLLFSVIRQESLFEPSIVSSADARGLMQIIPVVGEEIAQNYNWPANFVISDLDRPIVNVRLGTFFLKNWVNYFDGSIPSALSAYNAGIGSTIPWHDLAGGDVDVFVELIRFEQTRDYIRLIAENYAIYKSIYTHP